MELRQFMESGLLELYLIDALGEDDRRLVEQMKRSHPEVSREIFELEQFIEQDAFRNSVDPSMMLSEKMNSIFAELEKEAEMKAGNLPLISAMSSASDWLTVINPLIPLEFEDEKFVHVLKDQAGVFQALVVSRTDIEEEVHDALEESFLILEGTCTCSIEDQFFDMGPGDFMQIPLHKPHKVTITSKSVTAILQHVSI
jgi:mannose-6-phosphate isomerase-like protein (cupin superfamily)